ncbi:hypothetical protein [Rhodococcus zopfii]|uniref:hypothetical protein n=1 Tax=Rhodococcus zopfii TaxID=43772 RepID=UPI0014869DF3|nr:hypothetical protein [Rhodococcus zopfii]
MAPILGGDGVGLDDRVLARVAGDRVVPGGTVVSDCDVTGRPGNRVVYSSFW